MRKKINQNYLVFSACLIAIGILVGRADFFSDAYLVSDATASSLENNLQDSKKILRKTSESFRAIAKSVSPSVVSIRSESQSQPSPWMRRGGPDPRSLERFGFPIPPAEPQVGMGSGFFISDEGHIVTNHHVVEGAGKIEVAFDGSEETYPAKVVGVDPATDLAVLKVDVDTTIRPLLWADESSVQVGDWAIAVGSPFALTNTVTVGVVSAKGRNGRGVTGSHFVGELLQTDTAINPGNSGGPLVDIEGKVMGINTAIFSRSGGYMGIGFAIPSGLAKKVINDLINEGRVDRGWLGVSIQDAPKELKRELSIKNGVIVHGIMQNSPAAKVGIHPGDVLLSIGGSPIESASDLQKKIVNRKPGEKISIEVVNYESKAKRTLQVTLKVFPNSLNG